MLSQVANQKGGSGRPLQLRASSRAREDIWMAMGDTKPLVLIPMPSRDRDLLVPTAAVATHASPSARSVADSDDDESKPSSASAAAQTGREAYHKVVHSWASKKFMTGWKDHHRMKFGMNQRSDHTLFTIVWHINKLLNCFVLNVILFPIAVTFYVTWWFFRFVDGFFSPIYAHLGIKIFGLGFVTSISFIFVVGVFMSSWLGASVLGLGEWFIKRMPFVRHIYDASKQISAAISPDQNKHAFKELVIIRHPRIGEYAFGFITSEVLLQGYSGEEQMYCVYVPTNHLYIGDIFLVSSSDVIRPNMSVREGIEIVVSVGTSMPGVLSILETEPNQLDRMRSTRS
ncbi:Protein CONTINUOUS VASCULAR RING 1 [Zea mays]|uniref:Protein CONTINUOUS VASCULAR RING 1 n=1 Tax=Zea mays TaxID=4577 RepID=A0A3L6EVB1_MAIZE|nr:Protein CONTINUOUS VASCULAR RING 1 [Zea mays]